METLQDDNKLKTSALSWLYEMEYLDSPTVQQNLQENILLSDKSIKNCEILILRDFKDIMIYIELGIFAKILRGPQIIQNIETIVKRLLPSFRIRVVLDKQILNLTIKKLEEQYENLNKSTVRNNKSNNSSQDQLPEASNILPDQEEQTEDAAQEGDGIEQSDIQIELEIQDPE